MSATDGTAVTEVLQAAMAWSRSTRLSLLLLAVGLSDAAPSTGTIDDFRGRFVAVKSP